MTANDVVHVNCRTIKFKGAEYMKVTTHFSVWVNVEEVGTGLDYEGAKRLAKHHLLTATPNDNIIIDETRHYHIESETDLTRLDGMR